MPPPKAGVLRHFSQPWSFLLTEKSAAAGYALPKLYRKVYYCVSAAIHSKVVRVRSRVDRRNREPPKRYRPSDARSNVAQGGMNLAPGRPAGGG